MPHLLEIHPNGVVEDVEFLIFRFLLGVEIATLAVLKTIDFGGVDDVELHLAETIQDGADVIFLNEVFREDFVNIVVGEIFLLLGQLDEFADLFLNLRGIDAVFGFFALGLRGSFGSRGSCFNGLLFGSCFFAAFLAGAFLAAFLAGVFLAGAFLAAFFAGAFLVAFLAAFLTGAFFAAFFAAFLAGAFFAAFFATFLAAFLAGAFAVFLAAAFLTDFLAAAFFAGFFFLAMMIL